MTDEIMFAQSSRIHREGEGDNCMILMEIIDSNIQQTELKHSKRYRCSENGQKSSTVPS